MQDNYTTNRLFLQKLNTTDAAFIYELVNTTNWIRFIGERNVHTLNDAVNYIVTIGHNKQINYRVVFLKDLKIPVGVITFIKRTYLTHPDIGFAFLPQYTKKGYAFEASQAVLKDLFQSKKYAAILATTLKENTDSVHLLTKLGFIFEQELLHEGTQLQVYRVGSDKFINQLN
ncbi:MAG: GNAT family N-acetyltransferase [Chitinophagaceae bacterium]|nr:GNAT family N-acetyltransferase [Chitinophagaceae bacterium]